MKTNVNTQEDRSERELVIRREFDAPRELVWKMWTEAEHVARWWGPQGFSTTIKQMDVRPGGVWEQVLHGPDGMDYPNKSVFTEVVKPERIVYTHGGGKKGGPGVHFESTWTFEALGTHKTRVTIRHVFDSAEDRNLAATEYKAEEGGGQTLDRLALLLAPEGVVSIERMLDAPVNKVWSALTDIDKIRKWFFSLDAFKPQVGFEFRFDGEKDGFTYRHICTITGAVENKKLSYSWRYEGYEGSSLVTILLSPEGHKTRLTLTHTGLDSFPVTDGGDFDRSHFFKGWTHIIGASLKNVVEL